MASVRRSAAQISNFVLVAGYDYHGTAQARVDFAELALNHAASLREASSGRSRFVLFDVSRGLVTEQQTYHGNIEQVCTLAHHAPICSSYYQSQPSGIPAFRARGVRTLSIVDVYDYVLDLGAREPGTLVELAFVCHGWLRGPILVNSFDFYRCNRYRDNDDKDARPDKDFAPPNMDPRQLYLFRSAFCAREGRIFNFGCANVPAARDVLDQLCAQWEAAHDDHQVYEFTFDGCRLLDYITVDPDFFAGNSVALYRTLEQCRGFLRRMMGRSYSQKIANVAGVSCWGAFPGTYSSYEKEVPLPVLSFSGPVQETGGTSRLIFA